MANPIIKVKRSETASSVPTLTYGELGVNITDKKIFVGNSSNVSTLIVDGNASAAPTTINATNDTTTTTLYPIMVGALGSAQTIKARSTATAFSFNASTNALSTANIGVGVTAPSFRADIAGDARVTSENKMRFGGTTGTTNFYIQYNSTTNSLDFVAG
jgi:hypothetical protein